MFGDLPHSQGLSVISALTAALWIAPCCWMGHDSSCFFTLCFWQMDSKVDPHVACASRPPRSPFASTVTGCQLCDARSPQERTSHGTVAAGVP